MSTCSQCGREVPPAESIVVGDRVVCAVCKPAFLQRLREGAAIGGALQYAGFWIRAGARLLDGVLLWVVNMALAVPMMALAASQNAGDEPSGAFVGLTCATYLVQLLIAAAYEITLVARYGATLGKQALKLRVVMPDGSPLTTRRAVGRYFATMLSAMTVGIGFLLAAWDAERRTLHDRVAETRVVRVG